MSNENAQYYFRNIIGRLSREVQDLTRRANLNLIIGITTTLIGLFVLAYIVFDTPEIAIADILMAKSVDGLLKSNALQKELIANFLPRLTLVILIELFAYFFLKLYKQSIAEIKYYQNEITNIESRLIAIHLSTQIKDAALSARLAEELSKTERNFIISKDQTTVDIEKERLARSTYAEVVTAIRDVLKGKGDS